MISKWKQNFTNSPLSKKIIIIVLPGISLFAVTILVGFLLTIRSTNHMIYQNTGELLLYSSNDISNNLSSIQDMANFILEDTDIQSSLGKVKDSKSGETSYNAYSKIQIRLNNYYQKFKSNYVNYIQITNQKFSVPSSTIDTYVIPPEIQEHLFQKALEKDGRLYWITDYKDTYGVFLVRSIRRIDNIRLDDLGIMVINVNLKKMLEDLSISSNPDSTSYIISDSKHILYAPDELKDISAETLQTNSDQFYTIKKISGKRFFMVKGRLPITSWDYCCLSPYDNIYKNILFFQHLFILLLVFSFILCILLTRILMKPLLIHFKTLMKKIRVFGDNNFETIDVPYKYENRQDEIGQLHQQFDSMAHKIQTLIKENYEARILAKESQLKALEMQINPHFLYNTLQSIGWRAKLLKDAQISLMTESLGKLLRITLNFENKDSSLRQELELVKYYMNIQGIRYDDSLTYSIDVEEDLLGIYLPKFTLQPLVENAIHYTLEDDSDECFIKIHAHRNKDMVVIIVANTASSFEENLLGKLLLGKILPHGFGIGILNVNKRLELAFGESYKLSFFNKDDFAIAEIYIPYNYMEDKK